MELRHLRYFVAVAETCHFGKAAERLHLAQPALSQAIRQLEAELGASLLTRTTRQVALTPAGHFYLVEARRILASVEQSTNGVRRVADGHRGLLRIGLTGTAAVTTLPTVARVLQDQLPEVALEVHADLLTPALSLGLHDGDLDLALLRPPATEQGIVVRPVSTETLVLAVAADHPLANASRVSLADLRTEDLAAYTSPDSAVNEAVLRACHQAGFALRRVHTAPGIAVLLSLVAARLGVALVPESAQALRLDGVVYRDVVDAPSIELVVAWREDPSGLVRSVVEVLESSGFLSGAPQSWGRGAPTEVTR